MDIILSLLLFGFVFVYVWLLQWQTKQHTTTHHNAIQKCNSLVSNYYYTKGNNDCAVWVVASRIHNSILRRKRIKKSIILWWNTDGRSAGDKTKNGCIKIKCRHTHRHTSMYPMDTIHVPLWMHFKEYINKQPTG